MARKQRRSAHARFDELRQRVTSEGMKMRELQEQQTRAKAELERAGDTIAAAYASDDQTAIRQARQAKEDAMLRVEDLEHRVAGAELRVRQAEQERDEFLRENARELIDERKGQCATVALDLTQAMHALVKARRAYDAERQHIDSLVASVPGASPQADGVPTTYPWQQVLREVEKVSRTHQEAEVPRPRWGGLIYRQSTDAAHRQLKAQRCRSGSGYLEVIPEK